MALDGMLSAIRVLMLDAPNIPKEFDQRISFYTSQFADLSKEEVEDLAKIDPDKLGIYTMTIFAGERSGLKNHFKMTLAALEKNWSELEKGQFSDFSLVKQMHKVRPWKTNKFRDLAENFKKHLLEDKSQYLSVIPELSELIDFEIAVLDTRRHANDGPEAKDSLQLQDLSSMTVPQLLELNYQIPTYNRFRIYLWDFPGAKQYFTKNKELISQFTARTIHTVCSRNLDFYSRWTEIPEQLWLCLNQHKRAVNYELAELADLADEMFPDAENEEILFAKFMEPIAALVSNGALILHSS